MGQSQRTEGGSDDALPTDGRNAAANWKGIPVLALRDFNFGKVPGTCKEHCLLFLRAHFGDLRL